MWIEIAVSAPELRTLWMSPGGANPLTSPVSFALAPASTRHARLSSSLKSSSYSTPWTTPNTHQVTWSWIGVVCPGRQTRATIEKLPSGSTWSTWLRWRSGSPSRCTSVSTSGDGRWRRSWAATRSAARGQSAAARTAARVAVASASRSGAMGLIVRFDVRRALPIPMLHRPCEPRELIDARKSAAARARILLARVLPAALEVAPGHHRLIRVLAPHVLDVAVVRRLAGHLAQVPTDAGERVLHGHGSPPVGAGSRSKRAWPPLAPANTARSSAVENRPAGARIRDSTYSASVEGSGSRARMALNQMRDASRITTMIIVANRAARMPSTVEFVTTAFMSPMFWAGGSTSPASSASL